MRSNIPNGYDENGVRAGNGKWEDERDITDIDETIEDKDDVIQCIRCGAIEDREFALKVGASDEGHYLCEICASEMGLND